MKKFTKVMFVESDIGAATSGAALGPKKLYGLLPIKPKLIGTIVAPERSQAIYGATDKAKYLPEINAVISKVATRVKTHFLTLKNSRLAIMSGDHSTACGSISGLTSAFPDKRVGVIWIDAHADIHTPATTPSGNIHGMPLAISLGRKLSIDFQGENNQSLTQHWDEALDLCSPPIQQDCLVYIGIRDLECQEWNYIEANNISSISVKEMHKRGGQIIAEQVLGRLNNCDVIYVSFDIDSLDANLVTGTGTPVPDGLSLDSVSEFLTELFNSEKVKLFEVTELNPLLDRKNATSNTIANLLKQYFG
jgi:arginase